MGRLVTFGCSYTYGTGLKDIYKIPTISNSLPSIYAWPSWLGQKLKLEVINKSYPGSGNGEILNNLLRFDFNKDDIVVIMWSHFVRYDQYTVDNIDYNGKRNWVKIADIKNDDYTWDNAYKNYLAFHHAAMYLQNREIKNLSFIAFNQDYEKYPQPLYLKIPNLYEIKGYVQDQALDKGHFGIKSHMALADMLYNIIEKNELR
jgi:hypothetical protein